jgi:hypothetical protein
MAFPALCHQVASLRRALTDGAKQLGAQSRYLNGQVSSRAHPPPTNTKQQPAHPNLPATPSQPREQAVRRDYSRMTAASSAIINTCTRKPRQQGFMRDSSSLPPRAYPAPSLWPPPPHSLRLTRLLTPSLSRFRPQWRKTVALESSLKLLGDVRAVAEVPSRVEAALSTRVGARVGEYGQCVPMYHMYLRIERI